MPYEDGVFVEPTNEDRAGWAMTALNAYAKETRSTGEQEIVIDHDEEDATEQLEEVAGDLLCDLMHLLRKHGVDPTDIIDRGYMHFNAEEAEAEDDDG